MTDCKTSNQLNIQLEKNIQDLETFKKSYYENIELYKNSQKYMNSYSELDDLSGDKMALHYLSKRTDERIKEYYIQIDKIDKNIDEIKKVIEDVSNGNISNKELNKRIRKCNKKYEEIKRNIIINIWILEENKILKYMNSKEEKRENKTTVEIKEKIENNDTLIISEKSNKVVLPYTAEEILKILSDKNYESAEEVINNEFTRSLSEFKFQRISRFRETIKLAVERDGYKPLDAIILAFEMMRKKYLYPAIITACRNIDELDVYLDCLDKNEVEDFKIFNIKYELFPTVINSKK